MFPELSFDKRFSHAPFALCRAVNLGCTPKGSYLQHSVLGRVLGRVLEKGSQKGSQKGSSSGCYR